MNDNRGAFSCAGAWQTKRELTEPLADVQVDSRVLHRTPGLPGGSRRMTGKKQRSRAMCFQSCNCCKGCLLCCLMLKNSF